MHASPPNRLINEKSPYLLQHADNPVDWFPWGSEAFDKAVLEDKPVLLSIGYSTCHWCHVMAHESFEDKGIAALINQHFVAIKVDREERPDIDHIYMTATTAMTGQGGWPLTVFLTPQAQPFYGGTYFPPQAKWGSPGFTELLNSIAAAWKTNRQEVLTSSDSITLSLKRQEVVPAVGDIKIDERILDVAFRQLSGSFDGQYGGFGQSPKFPMGHNLSFLLRYFKRTGEAKALAMVERTLEAMSAGGIYDHLGGGFHRYATDQQWQVPHFEKMLYDQAILVLAYLDAYQLTGNGDYARVVQETLDYVLREMCSPEGGFYCAQDADSLPEGGTHKKEGAFYVFSQREIIEALGVDVAAVFNFCYGVEPQGNAAFDPHGEFIGLNILYRAQTNEAAAAHFNKTATDIEDTLSQAKVSLLTLRQQRHAPHLDDKVLTDWNGLMISALSLSGRILSEARYLEAACKSADFIRLRLKRDGRLLHRWREDQAEIPAHLEDYAFLINGLVDLYETTARQEYVTEAMLLADEMIRLFADQEQGGFFLTAIDVPGLIYRPKDVYDGAIPSGNSVAALGLMRLDLLSDRPHYRSQAQHIFECFAARVERSPGAYAFLLSAFEFFQAATVQITLHGDIQDARIAKMLKVVYKHFIPHKALRWQVQEGSSKALICRKGVCLLPTEDLIQFERDLTQ